METVVAEINYAEMHVLSNLEQYFTYSRFPLNQFMRRGCQVFDDIR